LPDLLSALVEFGYALARSQGAEQVLAQTLAWACRVTGATDAGIVMLRGNREAAVVLLPRPDSDVGREPVWHRLLGRGLARWASRREAGWVVSDSRVDPGWKDLCADRREMRSLLFLPFVRSGRLVGMFALTHPDPGHFRPELLPILQAAVPQILAALNGAAGPRNAERLRGYLEAVLAGLTDALVVLDAEGRITVTNPALERLLGRSRAELLGRPVAEAIPLDYGNRPPAIPSVLRGEYASFEMDLALIQPSGERIPVRLGCGALGMEGQRVAGAVMLLRDIRYLKEIDHMRSTLTDLVVHDLKAPLTSISSTLQLLQEYPPEKIGQETVQELLAIAEHSCQRLTRMIESMLDVERMEAGQFPLQKVLISCAELVDEVLRDIAPLVRESGVEMESDVAPNLPSIHADPDVLRRVLWNLLDNALKYTPGGGVVRVWARAIVRTGSEAGPPHRLPPGHWVMLGVSDSGPGISPEDQERIFDKFAQASVAGARRRGSGLGLTFCRLAVEAHGGRIWVESRPGGGSTFVCALPAG
jgi:PAS domain S-box-containing protein